MSESTQAPTSGPSILTMAAPLVVSFWMRAAVTFVDVIFAALIGDAAIAAIGLTIPAEFLMIAVWVGLSTGLTSHLSRAMGAHHWATYAQYLRVGWHLVSIVSPLFTLAGAGIWLAAPRMGLDPAVEHGFQIYGTVLIAGSAFTTFWSIIPDSIIKAYQDTRSTMWAGIWSNVINVGLNTLFLFVFGWGLFGIALSTVLGRIGGLAYSVLRARRHEQARRATGDPGPPDLDPAPYRAILRLAVPSSLTFGLMAAEGGLINYLLSSMRHATEAIAAYSIYYRVVLFGLQPVIATSVAMLPYAARRVGSSDWRGVRLGLRQAILANSVYALALLGPVVLSIAPWLAGTLTESEITARYTTVAFWTVPLACLLSTPFLLCRPVFEAMQRGNPGLIMALLRYLVLTGPLAWLGMRVATALAYPELYGMLVGTLLAGAISSLAFYMWLRAALAPVEPRPVTSRRSAPRARP